MKRRMGFCFFPLCLGSGCWCGAFGDSPYLSTAIGSLATPARRPGSPVMTTRPLVASNHFASKHEPSRFRSRRLLVIFYEGARDGLT